MKHILLEELLQLHVLVIAQSGGSDGLRDLGRLQAAVATQQQEVFGQELYKTVFEKAAALTRGVIADHPFVDGNKRTGTLVGLTFIELNGYRIVAKEGEVEDFAVKIAVDNLGVEQIAAWFEQNSQQG